MQRSARLFHNVVDMANELFVQFLGALFPFLASAHAGKVPFRILVDVRPTPRAGSPVKLFERHKGDRLPWSRGCAPFIPYFQELSNAGFVEAGAAARALLSRHGGLRPGTQECTRNLRQLGQC